MKTFKDFLSEGMDEYDTILHNLLKIVNKYKKTGNLPFGQRNWTFQGRDMGKVNNVGVASMLGMLGSKSPLNSITTRAKGYKEMSNAISSFIEKMTVNRRENIDFNRNEIAELAKTIMTWSKRAYEMLLKDNPMYGKK